MTELPNELPRWRSDAFNAEHLYPTTYDTSHGKESADVKGLKQKLLPPKTYKPTDDLSKSAGVALRSQFNVPHPGDPEWGLLKAVGEKNKGVGFNPYLTNYYNATQWLAKKHREDEANDTSYYTGWDVVEEDLDTDKHTPDDVIVLDSEGIPRVVSGYSLNSGKSKHRAAVLYNQYPNRKLAAHVRRQMKDTGNTRLFNRYLDNMAERGQHQVPFDEKGLINGLQNISAMTLYIILILFIRPQMLHLPLWFTRH